MLTLIKNAQLVNEGNIYQSDVLIKNKIIKQIATEINIKADKNAFQEYFGIDRADRDANRTRVAFTDLSTLVKRFPQSGYAPEAKRRLVWLLNRMARYELKVATYYYEREAYLAAANRGKFVVEHYSQSSYLNAALDMMQKSYEKLGLTELSQNAKKAQALNKRTQ